MIEVLWEFLKLWFKILAGRLMRRTDSHDRWRAWIETQSAKTDWYSWCWKIATILIGNGRPKK
ncbi:hypothetical protein A2716_00890 [candidate division WWE3 bacterium RIFCSPHIGHO2_01_FULL_40_23]|uniref:Uncharacterized protein n=1 Tax=candidate division WWE3 bacterium RIFCSPLOWO2_01_FULL_41_18 TaxID=1802625 RepID=A0A1F4VED1_UNCKA|nr:MAG: hypothetical protein A2716_00890 [candidate division WWE3 bacterium RIFCSPHIGHO2_01_FULL_40_23]OGC55547.1 MAG: hypothetical protein A3A78_01160 [candidate division WWE3 bacterium RIFCSPLOWO2_01_FULL_41_18]